MSHEGSLTLRLKHAEHELRRAMQDVLSTEGLLFEHWQIIAALYERPGLRMSDIAQAACLPPATLTRHMDRLVDRAVVARRIDPHDKRSAIVALSVRGADLAARLHRIEQQALPSWLPERVRGA
jgi:DNA-binding MarR family transcriptional regulator